jgi:hypothetical protein
MKRTEFMEKGFEMLISSPKITRAIKELEATGDYTLLAFLTPGSNWYSGAHLDYRRAKMDALIDQNGSARLRQKLVEYLRPVTNKKDYL